MKKRLLITSIVMMLVVAVALSTATYAWFTSNTSVTASTVTMTAAVNEADSIFIKWDGGTYGDSITTTKSYGSDVLIPMIPNELTPNTTNLVTTGDHKLAFQTAGLATVASVSTFKDVGVANPVYFATAATVDTPANADTIFIKNTSTANVVYNIKVQANFTPDYILCKEGELARAGYSYFTRSNAEAPATGYVYTPFEVTNNTTDVSGKYKATVNLVRVAIFTRDLTNLGFNDTESDYILRGVLANTASAPTYFGTIASGDSQADFSGSVDGTAGGTKSGEHDKDFTNNTYAATAGSEGFNICYDGNALQTLAAGGEVEIKVVLWLDGEALNDNTQGAIAKVGLTFSAVSAPVNP